nr:hypothetical protein [Candidatus Enterovibrio escacola]
MDINNVDATFVDFCQTFLLAWARTSNFFRYQTKKQAFSPLKLAK